MTMTKEMGITVYLETVGNWIAFPKIVAHSSLVALSGLRKVGFSSESVASWNLKGFTL